MTDDDRPQDGAAEKALRRAEWWSLNAALIWIETGDWVFTAVAESTSGEHRTRRGRRVPAGLIGAMRVGLLAHAKNPARLVRGEVAPPETLIAGSADFGARQLLARLAEGVSLRMRGQRQSKIPEIIAVSDWRAVKIVNEEADLGPHLCLQSIPKLCWTEPQVHAGDLRKLWPAKRGPKFSSGRKNMQGAIQEHIISLVEMGPPPPDRAGLRDEILRRFGFVEDGGGEETLSRVWRRALRAAKAKGLPHAEAWSARGRPRGRKNVHSN